MQKRKNEKNKKQTATTHVADLDDLDELSEYLTGQLEEIVSKVAKIEKKLDNAMRRLDSLELENDRRRSRQPYVRGRIRPTWEQM